MDRKWFFFILIFLGSGLNAEQISGGLLTCTPSDLNEKPVVYRFNENHLVRDTDPDTVYEKVGDVFDRYSFYASLKPTRDYFSARGQHKFDQNMLSENIEKSREFLSGFEKWCDSTQDENPRWYKYKESLESGDFLNKLTISNWKQLGVKKTFSCKSVKEVLRNENLVLPEPKLYDNEFYISKITLDTKNWTVFEEIGLNSPINDNEMDSKMRSIKIRGLSGKSVSEGTKCQLIQVEIEDIDPSKNTIPLQEL